MAENEQDPPLEVESTIAKTDPPDSTSVAIKTEPANDMAEPLAEELKLGSKAELETEPDAEIGTEPESEMTAEPDAEMDTEPEAQLNTESERKLNADPEAELDAEPEVKLNTESEAELGAESEAELGAESEAMMDAEPEANKGTEPNTESVDEPLLAESDETGLVTEPGETVGDAGTEPGETSGAAGTEPGETAELAGDDDIPPEDLEDGELSSDDGTESANKASSHKAVKTEPRDKITVKKEADDLKTMPAPEIPNNKRKRKSTESSEDQKSHEQGAIEQSSESSSSSDEETQRSERKRRKKEKERKKKEKKQKRKREKKEKEERKRRKKHGARVEEDYEDDYGEEHPPPPYADDRYDRYDDRWRGDRRRTYSDERVYDGYEGPYGRSPPPTGPYDSPPPDPYASPPDDSSDDEFSETLYSMVGDELMDPNVSAAEKEALFARKQASIPGLSASKMKKMMKKKRWQEQMVMRERDHMRSRRNRREEMPREKTQKCKFYAEGKCQKGERCQYSHNFIPAKKMEACKFFLQGYCAKGDMCIYLHSEVPCKYYHTGQKCFNAEKCKFSHEPLTDSTKPLLEKAILLEETGTFKPENKPSLLGSPPKESRRERERSADRDSYDDSLALPPPKISNFDPDDDMRKSPPERVPFHRGDRDEDMRLGSHRHKRDMGRETLPPPLFGSSSSGGAMSLFDLNVAPSAELQQKLDAGLYDELTAPLSESDDDRSGRYDSPLKRPKSFYTETLVTPDRRERTRFSSDDGSNHLPKRNRWGPDLPGPSNASHGGGRSGHGDSEDRPPKAGLLPLPGPQAEGDSNVNSTSQQAQNALSKILQALRSGAAANAATASSSNTPRAADPRPAGADPRSSSSDPWSAVTDPRGVAADPRSAAADPRGVTADPRFVADPRGVAADPRGGTALDPRSSAADPRAAQARLDPRMKDPRAPQPLLPDPSSGTEIDPPLPAYDPRADPRTSATVRSNSPLIDSTMKHSPPIKREPLLPAPPKVTAPPAELDGKFKNEMTFKLVTVDVLSSTLYIPAGAESSQELLRDPRIKKRVDSMKSTSSNAPPSLPDITADLQRMQNAMMMSHAAPIAAKNDKSRLSRTSSDSSNSRRNSLDKKMTSNRGQGDQNSNNEPLNDNVGIKARNAPRTMYSKINQIQTNSTFNSTPPVDEDDEEEDSLKIDMTET